MAIDATIVGATEATVDSIDHLSATPGPMAGGSYPARRRLLVDLIISKGRPSEKGLHDVANSALSPSLAIAGVPRVTVTPGSSTGKSLIRDTALETLKFTLEVLKEVADDIPVPGLSSALGVVLKIWGNVEVIRVFRPRSSLICQFSDVRR